MTYPWTLRTLRAAFPERFYRQDWFDGEAFMDTPLPEDAPRVPPVGPRSKWWWLSPVQPAIVLARIYCEYPNAPIWRARYLWCTDTDHLGQRVYVGDNGHGLEVHRHIHLTQRFGVPLWPT